jgi:hypothetical protein
MTGGSTRIGGSTMTRDCTTIRGSTPIGGGIPIRTTILSNRRRCGAADMARTTTGIRQHLIRTAWALRRRRRHPSSSPPLGRGRRLPADTAGRGR